MAFINLNHRVSVNSHHTQQPLAPIQSPQANYITTSAAPQISHFHEARQPSSLSMTPITVIESAAVGAGIVSASLLVGKSITCAAEEIQSKMGDEIHDPVDEGAIQMFVGMLLTYPILRDAVGYTLENGGQGLMEAVEIYLQNHGLN